MPTYDYICAACDHRLEVFQKITDEPLNKCPACGKPRLERQLGTGAAIVFKGSGFYQTDYRSESYRKAADKDSKPASDSSSAAAPAAAGSSSPAGPPTPAPSAISSKSSGSTEKKSSRQSRQRDS